jgi:uncharacterized protein YgiM (DUF1202 family)
MQKQCDSDKSYENITKLLTKETMFVTIALDGFRRKISKGKCNTLRRIIRRVFSLLIVSCLLVGLLQTALAADTYFTNTRVNFRSGPSTDSDSIRLLNNGTRLEMLEYDSDNWSRVRVSGTEGYVKSEFIRVVSGVTYQTGTRVNFRSGPSTDSSSIRMLNRGTSVEMLEYDPDDWSRVRIGGVIGYIKSEFLVETSTIMAPPSSAAAHTEETDTFRTSGRVNFRSAPSLDADVIRTLAAGTRVTALEYDPDAWSRVEVNGETGYINSEFLISGSFDIELSDWSSIKPILPVHTPIQIIDVRTGRSYNIQVFSKGQHADVEPQTAADTEMIKQVFGGRWTWTPRPVWVNVNGRTFAAAINGMPHGGSTISGNGMNGHLCLHFKGSRTHNGNASGQRAMQNAVTEAWNAR